MPDLPTDANPIVDVHRRRMTDFAKIKQQAARRAIQISYARGATFFAAAGCFLTGGFGESGSTAWFVAGAVLAAAFLALVGIHGPVLARSKRFGQLSRINAQAIARVSRDWDQVPLRAAVAPPAGDALSSDLDLFGRASLFHLVCTANAPLGIDTLRDWFLQPVDSATVVLRQQAVAELAPALDMRQTLEQRGLKVLAHRATPDQLLEWAEAEPWLARRRWLIWAARLLSLATLITILLTAMRILPPSILPLLLVINVSIGLAYRQQMHAIFGYVSSARGAVGDYTGLFQSIADAPVTSALAAQLRQQTTASGVEAWREIQRLGRIADMANLRFSEMSHFLVQAVLLWDFHVLALLERWQRRNGQYVQQWFEALSEWEALSSLAALAHDNPTWSFPVVENQNEDRRTVSARSLGHPLIDDDRRVANDVTVGPPGTVLIVTGSNMSGKSTLLRSLGTNIVLAQAGAPVCAEQFTMPPILLATSMRIHDSLTDGVSYYMAELRRLKQIVDTARSQPTDAPQAVLYLLDEILQGTNTAERQIAVRQVISHLLTQGAIGAISTHDLQLAAAPPLSTASQAVHFRETIHNESGRPEMTFDYTLREGPATTSNALKLLEIVGLGEGRRNV